MPVKSFVTLLVIILIALVFWWSAVFQKQKDQVTKLADQHYVDAFIRNFTLTAMDETGTPGYTLKASYYEHYNDSDDAVIDQPEFRLMQTGSEWLITADSGIINDQSGIVVFRDDVIMVQQNAEQPVQLKTSELIIDTQKQSAHSEQQVHITHGQLQIESTGMSYDNRTGQLELLTNVTGNYEN